MALADDVATLVGWLRRDILAFEDSGARRTMIFTDLGIVTTTEKCGPALTRTMLTEVDVPNHEGRLLPGSYAQLHFAVPIQTTRVSVPVNALLFRPEGPRVAVVGSDHKIHLKAVMIGRDFGNKIEILNGLAHTDQIVMNPSDSLEDGQLVNLKNEGGA